MKVLHVHHALYLPVIYVRELRRRGISADALYFGDGTLEWLVGRPDYLLAPLSFYPGKNLLKLLTLFFRVASDYTVIHFHSQPGFFHFGCLFGKLLKWLGMPDLHYLKHKGIRIVCSHWGCHDGRLPSGFAAENDGLACGSCRTGNLNSDCSDERTRSIGLVQEDHSDCILNHEPDFGDYNRHAQYHPAIVDFDTFSLDRTIPLPRLLRKRKGVFSIYHSAGKKKARGNERGSFIIEETISKMQKQGYDIDMLTTDGCLDFTSVGFLQRQADMAVDHLYYSWYGNAARECMAQAVPVATHLDPAWIVRHKELLGIAPPIITVEENSLEEVIDYYYHRRHELSEIGFQQREYLLRAHMTDTVIDRLLKVYRGQSG